MKKKILSLCLVLALAAVAVVGGTLAYFTDTDAETNVFTVGNVSIDLIESQYHRVNAGKGSTTNMTVKDEPLQGGYLWAAGVELKGDKTNTPDASNYSWNGEFFSDAQILADADTYKEDYFATESANMVPGDNVRKNPYVKNTGANDAYIRVRVLVPANLFVILDNGPSYWTTTALEAGIKSKAVERYNEAESLAAFVESEAKVTRDNIEYIEFDFTYPKPLAPNAVTFWNVWGNIAIDPDATAAQLANVDSFDVIFEADAIQAEGFANAADAFAAFDKSSN